MAYQETSRLLSSLRRAVDADGAHLGFERTPGEHLDAEGFDLVSGLMASFFNCTVEGMDPK